MNRDEISRLRNEYAQRALSNEDRAVYSLFNPGYLFEMQNRQRNVLRLLKRAGFEDLENVRILEVGCGRGKVLQEFVSFGASPQNLSGIDVLEASLSRARSRSVNANFLCADGQALPYADGQFQIVLQFTAFSSLLDDRVKAQVAREMLRVLDRSGGTILWYDFWLNPTNKATRGIRPAEIRRLFEGCDCQFSRVTLAPPLARRLAPVSWLLCDVLERIRLLNSHYLAVIRPSGA